MRYVVVTQPLPPVRRTVVEAEDTASAAVAARKALGDEAARVIGIEELADDPGADTTYDVPFDGTAAQFDALVENGGCSYTTWDEISATPPARVFRYAVVKLDPTLAPHRYVFEERVPLSEEVLDEHDVHDARLLTALDQTLRVSPDGQRFQRVRHFVAEGADAHVLAVAGKSQYRPAVPHGT
jgi:hypothetical protein